MYHTDNAENGLYERLSINDITLSILPLRPQGVCFDITPSCYQGLNYISVQGSAKASRQMGGEQQRIKIEAHLNRDKIECNLSVPGIRLGTMTTLSLIHDPATD